jgi:anti-sigma regulatory factor (Ser/Thr protein kinase)
MKELKIEAVLGNLNRVLAFVQTEIEETNCSFKTQSQISIVVEEIFVNIAHHAYDLPGIVLIRTVVVGNELRPEFEDMRQRYNPLEKADPDITTRTEDRPIEGLGYL